MEGDGSGGVGGGKWGKEEVMEEEERKEVVE